MDRRKFLSTYKKPLQKEAAFIPFDVARTTSGLNPYTGAWTRNEVVHLLKRTMFGSQKSDIDYFSTKTMLQAVDELLNPSAPLPAPPIKEYDTTGATTPD
ncbi:MAG TPA: hypothetical protein VF622_20500, partial [Segetibacter sp.]